MSYMLISILAGVVAAIASTELLDWSETFSEWLVKRNAQHLPDELKERMTAEWLAELPEIPGRLSRILWAADLRRSAFVIKSRWDLPKISPISIFGVRCADITISFILLIALLPLYLLIVFFITRLKARASKPFSIHTHDTLVGFDGRVVRVLRFNTQQILIEGDHYSPNEARAFIKTIQVCGLEKIPALFTVLGGSVSLVGPRAQNPKEVTSNTSKMTSFQNIKPGLCGLSNFDKSNSRCDGRCEVEASLQFVTNYSLAMYFRILLKNAKHLLHTVS